MPATKQTLAVGDGAGGDSGSKYPFVIFEIFKGAVGSSNTRKII